MLRYEQGQTLDDKPCIAAQAHESCPLALFTLAREQDWLEATADACVLEAAPYDAIVMSDVIYEEEIVQALVQTLRRLCHLHLQTQTHTQAQTQSQSGPPVYLCASHRTERVEELFFTSLGPWFSVTELTGTANPVLRRLLNRDAIAIWRLEVRGNRQPDLLDCIPPLDSIPPLAATADALAQQAEHPALPHALGALQHQHLAAQQQQAKQGAVVQQALTAHDSPPVTRLFHNTEAAGVSDAGGDRAHHVSDAGGDRAHHGRGQASAPQDTRTTARARLGDVPARLGHVRAHAPACHVAAQSSAQLCASADANGRVRLGAQDAHARAGACGQPVAHIPVPDLPHLPHLLQEPARLAPPIRLPASPLPPPTSLGLQRVVDLEQLD